MPVSIYDKRYSCVLTSLILLISGILVTAPAWSQPCGEYRFVEQHVEDSLPLEYIANIEVAGGLAYIGGYTHGFRVVDLTDPAGLSLVADFSTGLNMVGGPTRLVPVGDVGFIGGSSGEIPVIDLGDPSLPVEIARIEVLSQVEALAGEGDRLYATAYYSYEDWSTFYVFDISDPASPVELAGVMDRYGPPHTLAVRGDVVYFAESRGLHVYDVSDPSTVVETAYFDSIVGTYDLVLERDLLYVLTAYENVHILDVSVPKTPVPLSVTGLDEGRVLEMSVRDGLVAVACREGGLRIFDASDPASPSEPVAWPTVTPCRDVLLNGTDIVVMKSGELVVAKAEFPQAATPLYEEHLETYPTQVLLDGNVLYWFENELFIDDVSDPAAPAPIAKLSLGNWYNRMSLDRGMLYLSSSGYGVEAVDVSDPAAPVALGTVTPERTYSVHASGDLLAVGPWDGLTALYDVSDPAVPVLLGEHQGVDDYRAYGVAIAGDYVYASIFGVHVLDISDPSNIHTVASATRDYYRDLVADGEWIFAGGHDVLRILRFTPPSTLEVVFEAPTPGTSDLSGDLHLAGGILTIACGGGGVHLFDVSDPAAATRIAVVPARQRARCAVTGGGMIIVGTAEEPLSEGGRLCIFETACALSAVGESGPETPGWRPHLVCAPNPFNPRVRIDFEARRAGPAALAIHDLRGRRVATLWDGVLGTGPRSFMWNGVTEGGAAAGSGTYLVRLSVDGMSTSRKISLVR